MAAKFSNNMIVGDLYRAPPKMRELGIYLSLSVLYQLL